MRSRRLITDHAARNTARGASVQSREREARKRRMLSFLDRKRPAWNSADHPELKQGAARWVAALRSEDLPVLPLSD